MTPPVNGNTALFLDIDGTLLDLARTPDAVVVPDDLRQALVKLHDDLHGALAFVSGRSLVAIDRLFAPLHTAAIGCHGAEVRGADGKVRALARPMSDTGARSVSPSWRKSHPGVLLEDKIYALALHYRLAPEAQAGADRGAGKARRAAGGGRHFSDRGQGGDRGAARGHRQGRRRARPDGAKAFRRPPGAVRRRRHHRPGCFSHAAGNRRHAAFRSASIFPAWIMSLPRRARCGNGWRAWRKAGWRHDAPPQPSTLP